MFVKGVVAVQPRGKQRIPQQAVGNQGGPRCEPVIGRAYNDYRLWVGVSYSLDKPKRRASADGQKPSEVLARLTGYRGCAILFEKSEA